jgi:hypothetical protein
MKIIMLTVTILLAGIAGSGYTQPNPPPNPQGNPDVVPISGIEYLLLTGAIYGIYRLHRRQLTAAKLQVSSRKPQASSFKLQASSSKLMPRPTPPLTLPTGRLPARTGINY